MRLCVIYVAVFLLNFHAPGIETKFYLESTKSMGKPDSIKNILVTNGSTEEGAIGQCFWILYECDTIEHQRGNGQAIGCKKIENLEQKQKVYAVTNFILVNDLELLAGNSIEVGGRVVNTLSEVLTVGVEPRAYQQPVFRPAFEDEEFSQTRISQNIAEFVDFGDMQAMERLLTYLSINNIAYFFTFTATPADFFANYAAIMQKVIDASGHYVRQEFWDKFLAKWSSSATSQPRTKPQSRFLSSFQSRSRSVARPKSQPPSRSQSESQGFSRADIITAADFMHLKLFDPCFVLRQEEQDKAQAQAVCAIYCQFISMTIKLHEATFPHSHLCKHLKAGSCVDRMCVCVPRCDSKMTRVNMVFCNNILRLHVFGQGTE